ncbi:trichohyalin isoform X2 [Aplysia californica]|uniref:Trichohyalin isoform X2 n=1 Tax=Aplysia californica TaxID=6500 RepID=A0ABM0JT24_APLCA|nr:trichohyalin isoform X2 [Aplysia californica]
MSYGSTGGVHFDLHKNSGGPGIFWHRDKPKNEQRKFGYKSKKLRHAIRRPDDQAVLEAFEAEKELEKKKFNQSNKDFIRNNKDRFKPKEEPPQARPGSQHITPGTVTLTQEQLAALLASLGKTKDTGGDNPLKISFDTSNNKIEVERYESSGSGDEAEYDKHTKGSRQVDDDDDDRSDVGIGAFLGQNKENKTKAKRKVFHEDKEDVRVKESRDRGNRREEEERRSRGERRPKVSQEGPSHRLSAPEPQAESRLSWEMAKKEAGVEHVPDVVPWKHLTVGERKRLQWAREKAEVPEEYNPWGRPGAGAPQRKEEEEADRKAEAKSRQQQQQVERHRPDISSRASNIDAEKKRKQEELANEIEKLRREIQEAEEKKKDEEERIKKSRKSREKPKEEEPSERVREAKTRHEKEKVGAKKDSRDRSQRRSQKKEEDPAENGMDREDNQVQIVIVRKKKPKQETTNETEMVIDVRSSTEDASDSKTEKKKMKKDRESKGETAEKTDNLEDGPSHGSVKEKEKEKHERPAAQTVLTDDTAHLTKKEIEKRKWLAELDKQREEQRMRKQAEKEKDRAGIHDQWADRFVYHKTSEHISPRKSQPSYREDVSALGRAEEPQVEVNAPPAAMRSALVVGTGTLNENRYNDKKTEEKRRWLEELEKQREEQRQAKAAQKERDRQEDGTWADRYPTDHKKLVKPNEVSGHAGPSPQAPAHMADTQRTSSAPGISELHDLRASKDDDEQSTFLRGQGAFVDPVTRREQEEKRRVYLEYQAQVKAQIEEKDRLKREERERKIREDMEEERKLQQERDNMQRQLDMEQRKTREREELRQKQIAVLKTAMDEAQEKAQEEKNLKRIHHLREKGHDVSHLKATYEATTPRRKEYELNSLPGLGQQDSSRDPPPHLAVASSSSPPPPHHHGDAPTAWRDASPPVRRHAMGQSYTKEPYVEDRVLTPSRFRNPSKPFSDSDSPRREFGTQTLELKDLQAILNSLPDEVQIEYKMKVEEALKEKAIKEKARERPGGPSRKVHVKSASDVHDKGGRKPPAESNPRVGRKIVQREAEPEERKRPVKLNERPAWNSNRKKQVVKNSERDPFYQQKREEKEMRKAKRERQLQYLQELNKEKIPSLSKSPGRSRDVSPEGAKIVGERGRKPVRKVYGGNQGNQGEAQRDSSPNILSLVNEKERNHRSKSPKTTGRSSPLIPTVRHRTSNIRGDDTDRDPYHYTNNYLRNSQTETKYGDIDFAPAVDGDLIPFMRTTEILDPSKADEPMAISRENSRMERARRAYMETHNPASKGKQLDVYQDREREAALKASQDPILNPSRVTDHPTARQDRILQQLSSLKQTLMQRQKELEHYMVPEDEETVRG